MNQYLGRVKKFLTIKVPTVFFPHILGKSRCFMNTEVLSAAIFPPKGMHWKRNWLINRWHLVKMLMEQGLSSYLVLKLFSGCVLLAICRHRLLVDPTCRSTGKQIRILWLLSISRGACGKTKDSSVHSTLQDLSKHVLHSKWFTSCHPLSKPQIRKVIPYAKQRDHIPAIRNRIGMRCIHLRQL